MKLSVSILLIWFAAAYAADNKDWIANLDSGEGVVEFVAIGRPKAVKVVGKGACPKGKFTWANEKGSGKFEFALDSLDTGIEIRDEHMKKKYLETEKYPHAVLDLTSISTPSAKAQGDFSVEDVAFQGRLQLHGVTKPLSGTASAKKDGGYFRLDAKFTIKISDYNIAVPSYMGITVADEVQIKVQSRSPIARSQ